MSHKAPRKPYHYNKKSSSRTKDQSSVSLKYAMDELIAGGYEVVRTEDTAKHRKASILALAWIQKDFPDAAYSKSGRTIKMVDKFGTGSISVPVSDGHLSRDALKDLRKRTGLALNPEAEDVVKPTVGANDNDTSSVNNEFADASADNAAEDEDDDFDWDDDDGVYYVVPDAAAKPEAEPEVKKRTVTRTRRPRDNGPSV